jgi:hypothetical protein
MPHPVTAIHLSPVVQMKSLKHYCLIYQQVCLYKKKYEPRIGGPSELAALSGRLVRLAQKPALLPINVAEQKTNTRPTITPKRNVAFFMCYMLNLNDQLRRRKLVK